MIVYDLKCSAGHVFEAWFSGAEDYASQQERDLVSCPLCGDGEVAKVPHALAIGGGRSEARPQEAGAEAEESGASEDPSPAMVKKALQSLAKAQADAVAKSDYVGGRFAEEARSMHYGEQKHRPIYGETSGTEAKALREEGVPAMPLLFPVRQRSDA